MKTSSKVIFIGVLTNELLVLNTSSMTWSTPVTSGQQPSSRQYHAMAFIGELVYVFGGDTKLDYWDSGSGRSRRACLSAAGWPDDGCR
eukprot:767978-Hanusia_phi.AAC.4